MRKTAPRPVAEIDLVELKTIINRLLDHVIEARGIRTVALEDRYYWEVPAAARYRTEVDPKELDVGNLADDWAFVAELLREDRQPVADQMTELAPLIEYEGEVLGRDLGKRGG